MSLIQSAKLNGHDPYAYLKDVLTRLPTQPANRIEELLPPSLAELSHPLNSGSISIGEVNLTLPVGYVQLAV
jgi:hypothetical protein